MARPETPVFRPQDALELIDDCDTGRRFVPNQENFHDAFWKWDSCFIALGLAQADPYRAKLELLQVRDSQHLSGMVPHMVMRRDLPKAASRHDRLWGKGNDRMQGQLLTSGLTQPTLLATAARALASHLHHIERRQLLEDILEAGIEEHRWYQNERDTYGEQVVTSLHPWETGTDNSPSILAPVRVRPHHRFIGTLIEGRRTDKKAGLDTDLRMPTAEGVALFALAERLRLRRFDSCKIQAGVPPYAVKSVLVNQFLLRDAKDLAWIAGELHEELPADITDYLARSRDMMDALWDEKDQRFYDIDTKTGEHIRIPTHANILPIINHEELTETQGNRIISLMKDEKEFAAPFGMTTVSRSSAYFNEYLYWSGPMWPWMNRSYFHALKSAGETAVASAVRQAVIKVVGSHGAYEHYSPLSGDPGGARNFAPTAGSYLEMINSEI